MRHRFTFLIVFALLVVPVVNGLEIAQVGVYDFGVAYDIVYSDDVAYVSGNDGVDIFDITDRTSPVKLTRITCSRYGALELFLSDDLLYISATSSGLMIVDVSDPENPETISTVSGIDGVAVYVRQEYAYVASGTSYSIIDISTPSNPEIIATVRGNGRSYRVLAVQDTLYLGEVDQGLMVYDITDPSTPEYIRTVPGTTGIFNMASKDDTLYLGCHGNGIKILDISEKLNPEIIGSHNNGGEAYGIHIVDDYLLVADLQQGVEILDVSNPRTPTLLAAWTETHPHGVSGDQQYVYLADQDDGLEIFIYGEDVEAQEITPITDPPSNDSPVNQIPINASIAALGILLALIIYQKQGGKPITIN